MDGSARFGIDVDLPGMLVAHVLHARRFMPRWRLWMRPARAVKVVQVVKLPAAVAVVASGYWAARQAAQQLRPVWRAAQVPVLDTGALRERLHAAVSAGAGLAWPEPTEQQADATTQALQTARHVVDATYDVPFWRMRRWNR